MKTLNMAALTLLLGMNIGQAVAAESPASGTVEALDVKKLVPEMEKNGASVPNAPGVPVGPQPASADPFVEQIKYNIRRIEKLSGDIESSNHSDKPGFGLICLNFEDVSGMAGLVREESAIQGAPKEVRLATVDIQTAADKAHVDVCEPKPTVDQLRLHKDRIDAGVRDMRRANDVLKKYFIGPQ